MSIGFVEVLIILFITLGAIIGFSKGAIKTGVSFIGICMVTIISFIFKDDLMVLLYEHLPFFDFFGLIKGLNSFNIILYQIISFIIIFISLTFILKIIMGISGVLELLLKLTIFINIPSKILGTAIGAIQYYIYAFIILYILSFPAFNINAINNSKLATDMLNNTPIISKYTKDTITTYSDIYNILKNKENKTNKEINTEVLIALLDNNLISVKSAKKLIDQNKIIVIDEFDIEKYEESDIYKKIQDVKENINKKIEE